MTLQEIFNEIGNLSGIDTGGNDKGGIHTYLETYDRLFEPFRNGCTMLEIGLATGDSIKLWDRYFEKSIIFGVDISIVFPKQGYKNTVYILEADATKGSILKALAGHAFDIIIDDGDHQTASQLATFEILKRKMKKGGLYIIEDLLALDIERERYMALHENVEIIDMRHINGRFDNALCIIKF